MKLLVIGNEARVAKYLPHLDVVHTVQRIVVPTGTSDAEILCRARDADFILADAISPVSAQLIENMPKLKLIHSEGVGYNAIDVEAAKRRNVVVCNNAGVNARAVAEQTVLLMLACLRDAMNCHAAVCQGRQIETKERMMVEGIRELGDCTVGFIGFGAIAQATAQCLQGWGCTMLYTKRHRLAEDEERQLEVRYASLSDLVSSCDIVSLHVPVTEQTSGMVDAHFLARMKSGSILINTARGELVDNDALVSALERGALGAVGLDTIAPEPVELNNPLLSLSDQAAQRVVFSPHIGGVTEGTFYRAHRMVWENIARVIAGMTPLNVVPELR